MKRVNDGIDFVKHSTDGIDFQPHANGPMKSPQDFLHFSDSDVKGGVLHGSRRGSSPESSDAYRVHIGDGATPALHVYRSGAVAHAKIGQRKHLHRISGSFAIADIDKSPEWKSALDSGFAGTKQSGLDDTTAQGHAINSAERALKSAGFDGYESGSDPSKSVVLFGDHAISQNGQ